MMLRGWEVYPLAARIWRAVVAWSRLGFVVGRKKKYLSFVKGYYYWSVSSLFALLDNWQAESLNLSASIRSLLALAVSSQSSVPLEASSRWRLLPSASSPTVLALAHRTGPDCPRFDRSHLHQIRPSHLAVRIYSEYLGVLTHPFQGNSKRHRALEWQFGWCQTKQLLSLCQKKRSRWDLTNC